MTAPYKKNCVYCNQEITMSDETGKWLPYNNDGSSHDCRTTPATNGQEQKFTLDDVIKKLESIGIIINIERLMKEK